MKCQRFQKQQQAVARQAVQHHQHAAQRHAVVLVNDLKNNGAVETNYCDNRPIIFYLRVVFGESNRVKKIHKGVLQCIKPVFITMTVH